MLTAFGEAGFTGTRRVIAQRTVVGYVLGCLQNQYYGPLSGAGTVVMSRLSTSEYPALAETAAAGMGLSAEEEFRQGLAVVLRGLSVSSGQSDVDISGH